MQPLYSQPIQMAHIAYLSSHYITVTQFHYILIISIAMGICDKLSRHLYMLTYIYLNMDECWLISSIP